MQRHTWLKRHLILKFFYEKLIHCTCLAHGINRIAETIRLQFPLVNELVKSGKKIFVKAPLRVQHFKTALPNVSLPPEPVLTRWGTWLDAAVYYANNFQDFKKIVLDFTDTTTKAITDCKDVMQRQELQNNLVFIKANYNFVSKTIEHLEKQQLLLTESIKIIEKFKERILSVPGKIGEIVKKKQETFSKNEGFLKLQDICKILNGEADIDVDSDIIVKLKYAPITSVDVERSFSAYKNILSDRRHNFTMASIEQHLIISCFKQEQESDF